MKTTIRETAFALLLTLVTVAASFSDGYLAQPILQYGDFGGGLP